VRAVVQRVTDASVSVDGDVVAQIGAGLCALVGVREGDTVSDARYIAEKTAHLRVFPDDEGKMNRSVLEAGGAVLVVSQFTLYGDTSKGRRPSFVTAARPEEAEPLVAIVAEQLRALGLEVGTGVFGASMAVTLTNDGPVTIVVESPSRSRQQSGDSSQ